AGGRPFCDLRYFSELATAGRENRHSVFLMRQRWKPEGARQQGWLDAQHDVAARRATPSVER
ncbi:hypothetical protein R2H94_19835, partial (plasmid) [Klebsiella pneumoniae]